MSFYDGKTASEEFRDIVERMGKADGDVLVTVRLSSVRHAAIMLDREHKPAGGSTDGQADTAAQG